MNSRSVVCLVGAMAAVAIGVAPQAQASAAPYKISYSDADCVLAADGSATAVQKVSLKVSSVNKFTALEKKNIKVGSKSKFFLRPTTKLLVEANQGGDLDMVPYRNINLDDTESFKKKDLTWTFSADLAEPIVAAYPAQFFRYDIQWTLYFDGSKKDIPLLTFMSSSGVFNCEDIGF